MRRGQEPKPGGRRPLSQSGLRWGGAWLNSPAGWGPAGRTVHAPSDEGEAGALGASTHWKEGSRPAPPRPDSRATTTPRPASPGLPPFLASASARLQPPVTLERRERPEPVQRLTPTRQPTWRPRGGAPAASARAQAPPSES